MQIIHKGRLVLSDSIEALAQHLKSATLIVAFRQPPDVARLEQLPGVRSVQTDTGGRVRIFYEPSADPTDAVVRLAGESGWGLHEIAPERLSLEELFVELTATTTAEATTGEAAA